MIKVVHPGIFSSLQDFGRYGYRSYGVPLSGPMDAIRAGLARDLVGGSQEQALLEFYQQGPVLKFNHQAHIAICGIQLKPTIAGRDIPTNRLVLIKKNQELKLGSSGAGLFGYLAVAGGFKTDQVLGSGSYYKGITRHWKLDKQQILEFNTTTLKPTAKAHIKLKSAINNTNILEVYKGPEFDLLDHEIVSQTLKQSHILSVNCDRMGYRFTANPNLGVAGILTGPVQPGTVQLTPLGELMVLMRDGQTTGGYARVLQLSAQSISELAQQRPGSKLSFKLI